MITIDKLIYKPYPSGTDDKNIDLKKDFLDFIDTNKISRVLLLDENKCAKYVLHRSIIEGFIVQQYFIGSPPPTPAPGNPANPNPAGDPANQAEEEHAADDTPQNQAGDNEANAPRSLTFADPKSKGNDSVQAILKDGLKFIGEGSNLSDAKVLIKNYSACSDVFITKTGMANEPVLGWITNKTIEENSIV